MWFLSTFDIHKVSLEVCFLLLTLMGVLGFPESDSVCFVDMRDGVLRF